LADLLGRQPQCPADVIKTFRTLSSESIPTLKNAPLAI
jgi:hypothetical protein